MEKILTFTAIVILGLTVFAGCIPSISFSSGPSSNGGSISATINGNSFSGNYCSFDITTPGGILEVTGDHVGSTGSIYLTINNYTAGTIGSYYINDTSSIIVYGISPTASLDSPATGNYIIPALHGVITITSATSSQMTGTFSFTCSDNTVVTGGSFTAKND